MMDKEKLKKFDAAGQWIIALLLIMAVIGILFKMLTLHFNGDNYFMFAHARVLLDKGFVNTDPLSMHTDFKFAMTQWLYALIIYLLKINIGNNAVIIFQYIIFFLISLVFYNIAKFFITDSCNRLLIVTAVMIRFFISYCNVRPYFVTILLCLTEIYVLERFFQSGNKKILVILPLLSIAAINFHNTMWVSLFLVLACYVAEELFKAFKEQKTEEVCMLIVIGLISLLCGLINPYGLEYITYIFSSMVALKPFYGYIDELIGSVRCISFYSVVIADAAAILLLYRFKKKLMPIRHLLLMGGFFIMGLMAQRNNILYYSLGQIGFLYAAGFLKPLFDGEGAYKRKRFTQVAIRAVLIVFALTALFCVNPKDHLESCQFDACDYFVENDVSKDAKIFDFFNYGGYLEYLGFHPYMDPRAEMFGKEINKVKDVASEYINQYYSSDADEFKSFVTEYGFEYLIFSNGSTTLKEKAEQTNLYKEIYTDDYSIIYKLK